MNLFNLRKGKFSLEVAIALSVAFVCIFLTLQPHQNLIIDGVFGTYDAVETNEPSQQINEFDNLGATDREDKEP